MPAPLSSTCHDILKLLSMNGPSCPTTISFALERSQLTVYRSLKQLSARGLIAKRETPQGGRAGRAPNEWYLVRHEVAVPAANVPVPSAPSAPEVA